ACGRAEHRCAVTVVAHPVGAPRGLSAKSGVPVVSAALTSVDPTALSGDSWLRLCLLCEHPFRSRNRLCTRDGTAAAEALGRLGDARAVPALAGALRDPLVREVAARALG